MKKDRFVAFYDAIMAIIMTIAVLEFDMPKGASWHDLKGLDFQIIVYALSFFWLGIMWINIHGLWNDVEFVSRHVLFVNICVLFFSSMIPFFVTYTGKNFFEPVPQLLYGIDVIIITICNQISMEFIKKENPKLSKKVEKLRHTAIVDVSVKVIGIIIGMTILPPAIMISVFIAVIVLMVNYFLMKNINTR